MEVSDNVAASFLRVCAFWKWRQQASIKRQQILISWQGVISQQNWFVVSIMVGTSYLACWRVASRL